MFTGLESFNLTGGVQERAESSCGQEIADQFTLILPVFPTAEFSMGAFAATTDSSISAFEDPNPEFSFEDFDRSWTHVTDMLTGDRSPATIGRSLSLSSSIDISSGSVVDEDSPSPGGESDLDSVPPSGAPIMRLPCRFPGCGRICLREHTRRKHEESHTSKGPLSCGEPGCSTTFSRPHDKLRHEVRKHGYPSHTCSVCNNFFSHARGLEKHKCQATRPRR
ncbi:hypothetical protein DFH09DRAFT_554160 [Mycena vulgaris]|nr:hypothetical protein DFH09DRAFT_554160 [Mycena vulgaris]